MKRILLGALGNLAALFAAGMDHAWLRPTYQRQYNGKRQVRAAFKLSGRPTDKRHWHDPTEFYQSNALEAAVMKRLRRAEKLDSLSYGELNQAHLRSVYQSGTHVGWTHPQTLNPFYVAK